MKYILLLLTPLLCFSQTVWDGATITFSKANNASKTALIYLTRELKKNHYTLIDCQVPTQHLASMGAVSISRAEFLRHLP